MGRSFPDLHGNYPSLFTDKIKEVNILLSRKDRLLIGMAVFVYLVALVIGLNLTSHLIIFTFFLSILQKYLRDKQIPTLRITMLIVVIGSIILVRGYYQYQQFISGLNNDIGRPSQTIYPSISLPPKKEMKSSLILALSATPIPQPTVAIPKLKVELPPVGPYCNGCYSGPPGGYVISPITKEALTVDGQWVSGGRLTQTGRERWNYIYYVFKQLLPEIPKDNGTIIERGSTLKDAVKLPINGLLKFEDKDSPFREGKLKAYYLKLSEKTNKDGITIHAFEVRPTFSEDSLNRRDAIFIKNGFTYYIMFDWKTKDFDGTFDKIIDSIRFE